MSGRKTVGIVGARGYVGTELIKLICGHPQFDLAYVSSRERAGQRVAAFEPAYTGELRYSAPAHEDLPTLGADAVVLALPNGKAAACVAAFDFANQADPVIIDLSADYRFDPSWYYGLPELTRARFWMRSSSGCGPAASGTGCPRSIRTTRPSIATSSVGCSGRCSSRSGPRSRKPARTWVAVTGNGKRPMVGSGRRAWGGRTWVPTPRIERRTA